MKEISIKCRHFENCTKCKLRGNVFQRFQKHRQEETKFQNCKAYGLEGQFSREKRVET